MDLSNYEIKADLKTAKFTEIDKKIPSITGLNATSALNTVKNKIPNVSYQVEKTEYAKYHTLRLSILLLLIMKSL